MRLQQLERRGAAHLAGDDALEILLDGQLVDCANLVGLHHQMQRAAEGLRLFALPVETYADDHVLKRERCIGALRPEV